MATDGDCITVMPEGADNLGGFTGFIEVERIKEGAANNAALAFYIYVSQTSTVTENVLDQLCNGKSLTVSDVTEKVLDW